LGDGGFIFAFARCYFRIADSRLVFTSPIRTPTRFVELYLVGQLAQLRVEALGFFLSMHDRILKQNILPLDLINRLISLWHRHNSPPLSNNKNLSGG
jgi:hypothetical protein